MLHCSVEILKENISQENDTSFKKVLLKKIYLFQVLVSSGHNRCFTTLTEKFGYTIWLCECIIYTYIRKKDVIICDNSSLTNFLISDTETYLNCFVLHK
jgi:hypothetical protein